MSDTNPDQSSERERRLEDVLAALLAAEDASQPALREVLLTQNADLADELLAFLGAHDRVRELAAPLRAVSAAGSAFETTQRDPDSTLAEPARPAGLIAPRTETFGATTELRLGPADDPDVTAPNIANATDERELAESGTRIRYFGDYELLNVLGRGGMGVVYKARQISLNRPVALKMLQAGVLATEDDLRRFQNEAEAVAMLDHPHIVPILEVGHHEGQRYFSMKLIRGESLDRELSNYFNDARAAARLVMTAAEAVHHAHVRGILHRDLKPANVLLDERGAPHLTDFGLAKRVQGDSDLTQSGAILGTPPYMAPEQASGKRGMVTIATDIYGLGAILYATLTGRAPFVGDSPLDTLEQVRERGPDPLSRHNPRVPRDLEVICLKCLEKQAEMRYASAQALAEDLRRFVNSEAILARPVGLATRAFMWCARNPALARLGVALIFALFVAFLGTIAAVVIDGARRSETVARFDAEESLEAAKEAKRLEEVARQEAETNFDMAQKAVEDYLTNVSENTLLKEQDSLDIRQLRQDLLKRALSYYEKFVAQRKNDPRIRQQLAKAYFRVGQITREIGSKGQAMNAFRSALAIWAPLVDANPNVHELAGNLADCYLDMGRLESLSEDFPDALEEFRRSSAILERVTLVDKAEPRYQVSLADCYSEIGITLVKQDKPVESLAIHEKARDIQQSLVDRFPENLAYKKSLAENLNAIGFVYYKRHQTSAALQMFHEVANRCQSLMKELPPGPIPTWLLNLLALTQSNISNIHKENGAIEQALPFFEDALKYRSDLADLNPSVTRFREKLAASYREIAELQHKAHQDANAISSIQKSIDNFRDLVRAQPKMARFRTELARSWEDLGIRLDEARNNTDAMPAFESAVREQRAAIAILKAADEDWLILCYYLDNLGEQSIDLGQPEQGLPHYAQAIKIRRQLCRTNPNIRRYTDDLVKALVALGSIRRHMGDADAAQHLFADARKVLAEQVKAAPGDTALQVQLAVALGNEAGALDDLAQPEKAKPMLEDAAARFRKLADRMAPPGELAIERRRRSQVLWDFARVLRKLGLRGEAEYVDDERIGLWKDRLPNELVALALEHTSRANLIGYGKTLVSAQAKAVRELDLDQAADELKLAISRGFKDLRMLKSHPDSGALLSRDGLAPVIDDLAFPRWPFSDHR